MRTTLTVVIALSLLCGVKVRAQTIDLARCEIVDLTHSLNAETLFWPTPPAKFELRELYHGPTAGGFFYAANSFCTPEHGGTHMDAPIHFSETGWTTDRVPLSKLIGPAVVIDVSDSAMANPDYLLTDADIERFERRHGAITPGTIVLLRTGWETRWPDRKAYFGDDTPGDASRLHFPGFGADAARTLAQRKISALGLDTPSIDHGPSKDFIVHQIVAARNIPAFENLRGLADLPPRGATVVALPAKIEGGTGGPLRAIAFVPKRKR